MTATGRRARSWSSSRAGRCRSRTRACAPSTWPCARGCGVFDVSHMGEIETSGPRRARAAPAAALQRRLAARGRRRPVLGSLPARRRRARRPVHLPARRRPLPDGHQRRQPRPATWPGFASTPATSRPSVADRLDDYAMLAVQGPEARGDRRLARRRRAAASDADRDAGHQTRRRGARVRHRLHGRGRGRDPARTRSRAASSGTTCSRPARPRPGSPPATRCGSRSASTSTATT